MSPDAWGLAAICAYAVVVASVLVYQAVRCSEGPVVWTLYVVERLYVGNVFRWRASGRCPFPSTGPAIVIANHRSPVDPLMIWMNHHLGPAGRKPIRKIGFLMAREYYDQPGFIGWICRVMEAIPLERDGKDISGTRAALRRLRDGKILGIFPEGGINTETRLRRADVGVAWLALSSRAPVFPVFIHGAPQAEDMVSPFYTFCRVRVVYGEPVDLSEYYGRRKTQEVLREVTDRLMGELARLGGVEFTPTGA